DESGTAELRREIEETRAKLDARRVSREDIALTTLRLPEDLAQVQRQLPPSTAVLAYFVGESGSHAWLLARDRLRHITLPGRAQLQRAIEGIANPRDGSTVTQAERQLAAALFGPLLDGAPESRLLIIPDGLLHTVPFAA